MTYDGMPASDCKARVLAVAGDPGGGAAMAPVIRFLRDEGICKVHALAYNQSCNIWSGQRIDFVALQSTANPDSILSYFTEANPSIVFTATSVNGLDFEKEFVRLARRRGIPSVALLDFWSNYKPRFSSDSKTLDCLPDQIAVMDKSACDEMAAEGFDRRMLIITGQPAYDDLAEKRMSFSNAMRASVRHGLGISDNDLMVLFASQPLTALYGSRNDPQYLGYDEHSVLNLLLNTLERIAADFQHDIALVIRPHPRENGYYDCRGSRVKILIDKSTPHRDAVLASDLVTGMTTALLVESALLGCVTLSLQPELRGADLLPTNRMGTTIGVFRSEDVLPTIQRLLLDSSARAALIQRLNEQEMPGGAAKRVAELLYTVMKTAKDRTLCPN